jgi:DNA-binding response OmpR family regulator
MRILLVEDERALAEVLATGLRARAYAVDVAHDGDTAVYQASVNPYDAIVLDVMLPLKNGLAVAAELRRRGSSARILMLTARDTVEDRVAGLDAGADDYLVKPFDLAELLARLRALLRRGDDIRPMTLVVGDLMLDTGSQQATRASQPLRLTTKEFALLEYLARRVDCVVGRAEISDHVWDDSYDPCSNLIESYVNRLRRKVDREGMAPLIHTRRGAGYMLSATLGAQP